MPKDAASLVLVHLTTLACCLAAGWFVWSQGTADLPVMDEWDLLAQWLTADSTAGWLTAHHNEHRYPLAKAVWLGTLRLTGYDFKAPMYVTVGLLTAAAVLFQWTARWVRGRSHPIDALFPVVLLHFGHGFNLVMGYQLGFALVTYAAAGWVWTAGRLAAGGGSGWAVPSAVYTTIVALCGGFGLAFTPVLVLWLGYLAVTAGQRRAWGLAGVLAAWAVALIGYAAWVYLTMPRITTTGGLNPFAEPGTFVAVVANYLCIAAGYWPVPLGVGVWVAAAAVGYGAAVVTVVRRPTPRPLAIAVLLVLAGTMLTGVVAAAARGGGMTDRFVTPSAAGLCAVVLATTSLRRPPSAIVTVVALAAAAGVYWVNVEPGLRLAYQYRHGLAELRQDLTAGSPPLFLAGKHGGTLAVLVGDRTADHIRTFRRAGLPLFRGAAADPDVVAVPVAGLALPFTLTCTYEDAQPGGRPPVVPLPSPPPGAVGLRCRVTVVQACGGHRIALHWTDAATGAARRTVASPSWLADTVHLVFPLSGTPTDLRLIPASRLDEVRVESAEWLLPSPRPSQ